MSGWAEHFDRLWQSPALPIWLLVAVAGFVGLIFLATLLRAERPVTNSTLALVTIAMIVVTIVVLFRSGGGTETATPTPLVQSMSSLPALACLDDLAGETVLSACEKMLFASPDVTASAVAYTASQLTRLQSYGDAGATNRPRTPDIDALRRAIERDRYGLVAYVLSARERCQPQQCAAYAFVTDHRQISAHMAERTYEATIEKYAPTWNAPPAVVGATSLMTPTQPTGKPTNADFPTASSIPPVSIMNAEPPSAASRPPTTAAPPTQPAAPRATAAAPSQAPKKQPAAPKKQPATAPVPSSSAPSSTAPAAGEQ